jgi:hypothetical protein
MLQASQDTPYQISEAKFKFENLGTTDKYMITFVGKEHMMIYEPETISKIAHFAVAFFGFYLQGHQDYAEYFSKEFVDQQQDLAFGLYEE